MTRTPKQAAAPAPTPQAETVESPTIWVRDVSSVRDEFAMRAMAAILSGIATRGGMAAIATESGDDHVVETAYRFADMALRVRELS